MASDETVAEIVSEIRMIPWKVYNQEIEIDDDCGISQSYCNTLSHRLEAAHKRAIAELRDCLDEAVTILNCHIDGNPETCDDHKCILFDHENKSNCIMCKWRKALKGGNNEGK